MRWILIKKEKRNVIISVLILSLIGLLMVYSSSYVWSEYKFGNKYHFLIYQSIFLLLSIIACYYISKVDLNKIKKNINLYLLLGIILLVLVIVPGIGTIRNGSRSWFTLGPISFQPSEYIKLVLIIFASKYLEKYHTKINKIKDFLLPLILIIFFIIGLIMLEPDFGSSMIIVLTIILLLMSAGLSFKFFGYIGALGSLLIIFIIMVAPYRMMRIVSFLNPWKDPLGSGYQIIQSLYAIGPGGLFGHGLFNSRQKYFYLPEPQTDFIFSIYCEELGFIGTLFLICTFLFLFYNIYKISVSEKDLFKRFLSFGILSSLIIQTSMNLSVVVGLIPVTGVTLPFLSYGGSSLLMTYIYIGILLNIITNTK